MDFFEANGAIVVKINNVGIRKPDGSMIPPRQKGISDLIVCYKGRFVAIEVKSEGRKPTDNQLVFINNVKAAGGWAMWTDNIEDAIAIKELIDKDLL